MVTVTKNRIKGSIRTFPHIQIVSKTVRFSQYLLITNGLLKIEFVVSRMATKFDKVVKREVCRVTTKGTQTFSFLDGDATEAKSNYLLAIAEKVT